MTRHQIGEGRRRAAVGHVQQIGCGHRFERLDTQMRRRALAG